MKFSSACLALAAYFSVSAASVLQSRVDNRLPVFLPDGETTETACAQWQTACVEYISANGIEGVVNPYCFDAPKIYAAPAINVICSANAVPYTTTVIEGLGWELAHS